MAIGQLHGDCGCKGHFSAFTVIGLGFRPTGPDDAVTSATRQYANGRNLRMTLLQTGWHQQGWYPDFYDVVYLFLCVSNCTKG